MLTEVGKIQYSIVYSFQVICCICFVLLVSLSQYVGTGIEEVQLVFVT